MTDATLTANKLEVLHGGSANVLLTANKLEVMHGGSANIKLTSSKMEVLYRYFAPSTGDAPRRVVVIT